MRATIVAVVVALIALVCVFLGVLVAWSPGRTRPYLGSDGRPLPGSIAEKVRVNIGGVEQGMFIRGRDRTKPVLLFVHGGPGMPELFMNERYATKLEDDFVVCWWEQRGAGISYDPGAPASTLTADRLVSDTIDVADYLRKRFGRDRIYLFAHSWGTLIGIQAAAKAPDRFAAYIGMGQIADQHESESRAYSYELEHWADRGDTRMVKRLRGSWDGTSLPMPEAYLGLRDEAMHPLGVGTTVGMRSVITSIFVPVWQTHDYTIAEKIRLWQGKAVSRKALWETMLATDLASKVTTVGVPVYICQGAHDYTANYDLAKAYFAKLRAPVKGFYTFRASAHSPLWEEPDKMRRVLTEDVVAGKTSLADPL